MNSCNRLQHSYVYIQVLHKLYIYGLLMEHNLENMQRVECINDDTILFPPKTYNSLLGVWEIHDTVDNGKVILDVYSKCKMSEDVNMP